MDRVLATDREMVERRVETKRSQASRRRHRPQSYEAARPYLH